MSPRRPTTTQIRDIRLARGSEILIDDRGSHWLLTPTTINAEAFLKAHAGGALTWSLGAAVVSRERAVALIKTAVGAGLRAIFHPNAGEVW
jgi:hypothetical protein